MQIAKADYERRTRLRPIYCWRLDLQVTVSHGDRDRYTGVRRRFLGHIMLPSRMERIERDKFLSPPEHADHRGRSLPQLGCVGHSGGAKRKLSISARLALLAP